MMTARTLLPFALVALSSLASCKRAESQAQASQVTEEAPIKVSTVQASERSMPRYLSLTGSLTPNQASDVAADTTGKILETKVERGSFVEKNAVMARVDPRTAGLVAAEANANAESAVSQEKQAQLDCQRAEELWKTQAIAQAEYDRQKTQCQVALSSAKAAEARVHTAMKNIGDTNIRAPFAGMIAERYVSAGEYVQPSTKIARVVDIDPLRLELTVPEQAVAAVKEGLPVDFHVAAFDRPFRGKVRYIGPSLRETSRDLVVEAVVDNPEHLLRPGMFATAKVALGDAPTVSVPKTAIRADGQLRRLYAVTDGRIEERLVRVGVEKDGFVAIEEGVKPGDEIVNPVPDQIHDGQPVQK